ncbi:MAG: PSD1 and planctomycete cytochrome C domain-containing protein [Planctomycetota bacterium]|nr:PSD1 and planctomycete cytochrome C domain-containing protein [Planctomycetota bacterium]
MLNRVKRIGIYYHGAMLPPRRFLPSLVFANIRLAATVSLLLVANPCSAQSAQFNRDIRPLLAEHCLECHGPDKDQRNADLRLDVPNDADQTVIVPFQPDVSVLIHRVTTKDPDLRMPPPQSGEGLNNEEIEKLRQWIDAGATYQRHWSLEPIHRPKIPDPHPNARTEIDRFILKRLQRVGLDLSPTVSRERLIRRATFDLTGLPPTWKEVQAFISDSSDDAFAKVVDRLLQSPQYGERWGRHWLDLARYADTHGGSAIGFKKFPFSYAYRDYVIAAFNRDLPYDQFLQQQIAADQLSLPANDPALAALGFLTVGRQYRSPHDVIDDQIDVVTRGLMGLTVSCARCHDHKFDPIPTTDYYSLYATLASSDSPARLPVVGVWPKTEAFRQYETELNRLQLIHDDMARDQTAVLRGRLRMQVGKYLRRIAEGIGEQDLAQAVFSYRTDDIRPHVINRWQRYLAAVPNEDPVFRFWIQLREADDAQFSNVLQQLIDTAKAANGDPQRFKSQHQLATQTPSWNPQILAAIEKAMPANLAQLAEVYGTVFAQTHRDWLSSLLEASLEASVEGEIIPDQDARHTTINSATAQQLRRHLYDADTPTALPEQLARKLLNRTVRDNLSGKAGAIHNLDLQSPGSPPRAMVLQERKSTDPFHVMLRGNPINRGERVTARFLSALSESIPASFDDGKRRLGLAKAIVAESNPLTRRVVVNWVWQHHFGEGLVRTPDDFGTRGESPTHPELLDHLASTLFDQNWSLKRLHRQIMLSAVYQQGAIESAASRMLDPDNRLLWRMPRQRLDLESMRDAMLAVAGELNTDQIGGRPFDFLGEPIVPRRSVYALVNRDILSPLATTFDAANPSACTAQRPKTTVPQQTLFALNSDFIQDRATAFAKQSSTQGDSEQRVQWMFQVAYSRDPTTAEVDSALQFIQAGQDDTDRWTQFAHVLLASNEFVFLD